MGPAESQIEEEHQTPQVGLEPTTIRLTAGRSAIELLGQEIRGQGFEPR